MECQCCGREIRCKRECLCVNALDGISNEALEAGVVGEMISLLKRSVRGLDGSRHGRLGNEIFNLLDELEAKAMTQHTNTLRELTHQLFNGEISAEEYRRAVAPTHPHPHGALPEAPEHIAEMVEAIRTPGPSTVLFCTPKAEARWFEMKAQAEGEARAQKLFPDGLDWQLGIKREDIWAAAKASAKKTSEAYYNQDKRIEPDAMWLGPSPIKQVSSEEFVYFEKTIRNEIARACGMVFIKTKEV